MIVACYHPLTAWSHKTQLNQNNKQIIRFKMPLQDCKEWEEIKLPCGQCIGCRLEYSRQWAIRCCLEAARWEHNYFLTLTYDELHLLPLQGQTKVDVETGELIEPRATVDYNHTQKFMKDLRRHWDHHYHHQGIRFYGCGDYGSKNQRPHYHIILFNIPIFDLKKADPKKIKSTPGYPLQESDEISKIWGRGTVAIGEVTFEAAAYTARYMLSKHKGKDKDYYDDLGIEPIKSICSNRPGIAKTYWDEHREKIVEYDKVQIFAGDKVVSVKPPKYYDRIFDGENTTMADVVRHKRKDQMNEKIDVIHHDLDVNAWQYEHEILIKEEGKILTKIKSLQRKI